jgi:hypothetical protein
MAQMKTLTINGTRFTIAAAVPGNSVTLLSSAWIGNTSPYSQVVALPGVTACTKVDLQPSVEQLEIFHEKDVAFTTENNDGVVTVYAIGDKPKNDYTIQVTMTEVDV